MEHNLYDNDTADYYDDGDTLIMGLIFTINRMIVRKKMIAF